MRSPSDRSAPSRPELLAKVEAFRIDEGEPALPFVRRLARENGWSAAYAERVVREYKRFAYLAAVAGHVVCPSEDVDQAWHLHLTYTRSYWTRFCGQTLGTELHHDPTRGGPAEADKHRRLYAATLESYERHFGEAPPRDVWPGVEERFSEAGRARRVDPSRYWVIRKPWTAFGRRPLATAALVAAPLAAAANPLDFDGPTFLGFYAAVAAISIAAALTLRLLSRRTALGQEPAPPDVTDPYEAACLANGVPGVIQAALTALAKRGNLVVAGGRLTRGPDALPADAPEVERAVYAAVPEEGAAKPGEVGKVLRAARPHAEEYRSRLRAAGLLQPDPEEPLTKRVLPATILSAVVLLGVAKIAVGLSRGRPVGFLVLMTLGMVAVAVLFLVRGRRTRRGAAALEALRRRHRGLVAGKVDLLSPADAALMVGLFGATSLAGSELTGIHELRRKAEAAGADGGWGGGGCSGGSGCGGGCGGGGCGGCGS